MSGDASRAGLPGALTARRVDVARILPLRAAVLRPGRPVEAACFDGDEQAEHFALFDGDEVVGCVSVLAASAGAPRQLRGMAVAAERQGGGVGAVLLRAVHEAVGAPMWCNARQRAATFYARHGWRVVSDPFDIVGIGPHVRMTWSPEPPT